MRRYSAFAIAREAARHHLGWERAWAAPEPKQKYDVIVVGPAVMGSPPPITLARTTASKTSR